MAGGSAKIILVVVLSFVCGAAATAVWTSRQWNQATSCEALLAHQNIPNPFHLTGTNCAVMDISKGYRAEEPTQFAPESVAVWRGRSVKVLGRSGAAVVVQDCPKCQTFWLDNDPSGRTVVRHSPEVQ
jgi:hypothetical protein